ncbi:MAG: tetraacyldisaccharide 4'-kinase [Bacteroidetes bacterium]|nr:tetraacyldisaccharide 4'-kinase [Bacteroidota bacterium]
MPPGPFHFLSLIRFLLYPFALIYGVVVWLRNRLYDSGFFSSVEFSLPVICVGNLSVGGTGKTPHVEYLLRLLQYQYRVATMSRGYKRSTQGFVLADENSNALRIGDEPMQYHLGFPEVAVSVAEERMTGIPLLLQHRPDVEVVLLDDAYQHRSVKAGLNILITDFSKPYFQDFILPYGRLREGRSAARRAHTIIVSKCPPGLPRKEAEQIVAAISPLPHQQVFFSSIRYGQAYEMLQRTPVDIQGKQVLLVCGIARPEPLAAHLNSVCKGLHLLRFSDHHYFGSRDLEEIAATYKNWQQEDKIILTTEKDATRMLLHRERLVEMNLPIAVLPIEISFLFDAGNTFNALIEKNINQQRAEAMDDAFPAVQEAPPGEY